MIWPRNKKRRQIILAVFLLLLISLPLWKAEAALVPCGRSADDPATENIKEDALCQTCDILVLGQNIVDFIFFNLVPAIAALAFIYAGFSILLAGGVPSRLQAGQNLFRLTIYGLLIMFLAWLMVNTVLQTIAGDENIAEEWWKLECKEGQGSSATEIVVISEVKADKITANSAEITWKTNVPATSQVVFGEVGSGKETPMDNQLVTSHLVQLTGLDPSTIHIIKAVSQNTANPPYQAVSEAVEFKTLGAAGGTPTPSPSPSPTPGSGNAVLITTSSLPEAAINQNYSATLQASGGQTPYRWLITSGALPTGLDLDLVSGVISGKPITTGTSTVTFVIEDSSSPKQTATKQLTLSVKSSSTKALGIDTGSLPDAVLDERYSQVVQASGGTTPYFWSVSNGQLPLGLNISSVQSEGVVSGKPMGTGTFTFTLKVQDSSSTQLMATRQFTIKVFSEGAILISDVKAINVTGTTATITWTTSGPASSQVEYTASGGSKQATSTYTSLVTSHMVDLSNLKSNALYSVQAISVGSSGFRAVSSPPISFSTQTITGALAITTTSLPNGMVGQLYLETVQASGGQTPYTWSVSSGSLPPGVSLNSLSGESGNFGGSPTTTGTFTFTLKVQDSTSPKLTATRSLSIKINASGSSGVSCVYNGTNYSTFNLCTGQKRPGGCGTSTCSQYISSIEKYAGGVISVNVLKTFMVIESDCNIKAATSTSYGLMQLRPETANTFKAKCGVTEYINSTWLTDPRNADKSICIGAEFMRSLAAGTCGTQPRNIYAGYNAGPGNCGASSNCAKEKSCSGETVKKWECPYDDDAYTVCNTGMYETKQGATYVNYCLNNLGF